MNNKISAIILAGGQGRRFGNKDKGLVEWQGRPLISHVIDSISPQVTQIVINCNRNLDRYQSFGYSVCTDKVGTDQVGIFQGPLAGIHAALPLIDYPLCLICPCDMPNLPTTLVSELNTALTQHSSDIAYPRCNNRQHYLPALIKTELLASLQRYLQGTDRSVKGWYTTVAAIAVEFGKTDPISFANINSAPDHRQ